MDFMNPITLSKSAARRVVLDAQMLNGKSGAEPGKAGLRRIIDRLGYIQIDTINIIERAHHHVLWTRQPGYAPAMLHDLQAADRAVFEYWAHAMSFLPMPDYRFSLPRMRQFRDPAHPWMQYMTTREKLPLELVMNRIRAEGPLTAKDFTHPADRKRGPWWDWKPAKSALELLFWQGELMISERRNFQKVYDLTERVLPPETDTRTPGAREMAEHVIRRSLGALGIAGAKEIQEYLLPTAARDSKFPAVAWDILIRTIGELVEEKAVIPVLVDGLKDNKLYALRGAAERIAETPKPKGSVALLSPFDNLIIQRDRTRRLFDFQYMLECYTPGPKRVHGYFVLPVLFGDRLVGRIDPQADRKSGRMILRSVALEGDFKPTGSFYGKFAKALAGFAAFNGCDTVTVRKTRPAGLKSILNEELKNT
jgi:uncharacterized protein YcaQ